MANYITGNNALLTIRFWIGFSDINTLDKKSNLQKVPDIML